MIIGRHEEQKILKKVLQDPQPQLLAVYGRRRIGKTFLISEFFKDKGVYFEITGIKDGSLQEQLFQFSYEFSRQFRGGEPIETPKSWAQAFHLLNEAIESLKQREKIILFFDEVPWLASRRSRFLNALEHFWNRYLSRTKNLVLIICGSSASWVIRNIINNKGGLHGRVTQKIRLLPFSLSETEEYLKAFHIDLDRKQIIDLYMALGGVPKYLAYASRGKSSAQIINETCFSLNGALHNEFHNLYRSLFENYTHYITVVKALAKKREGLTKEELLQETRFSSGGGSTKIIEDLVDAGFILYVPAFQKKKAKGFYRLIDEYSLFYLTWMAESSSFGLENIDPEFWIKKQGTAKWRAWSGYAFESVCFKHIQKIKHGLGIEGVSTIESGWHYVGGKGTLGAQIDLVIERADNCINLCEIKYTDSLFTIDKSYEENLKAKKRIFKEQTATKKALFITMMTPYGTKKNSHYLSVVDNELTMDGLF